MEPMLVRLIILVAIVLVVRIFDPRRNDDR